MIRTIFGNGEVMYYDTDTGIRYFAKHRSETFEVNITQIGGAGAGYIFRQFYTDRSKAEFIYDELRDGCKRENLLISFITYKGV